MALMKYREPNKARCVGTRPAHQGTQIAKSNGGTNGNFIVHTVTAGKVFHLVGWTIYVTYGSALDVSQFFVRNTSDITQYIIALLKSAAAGGDGLANSYYPPLEIPEGYDIVVYAGSATTTAWGFVFGWEE